MEHYRCTASPAAGILLALSLGFAASHSAAQGNPSTSGIDAQRISQQANEAAQKASEAAQGAMERAQVVQEEAMRQAEAAIAEIEADTASMEFLTNEIGGPREVVKNAPYTAEAVTESTRVLMDGNRIVHKSTTLLARDSAGRTRQETKRDHGVVYISDPIEQRSYVLRPVSKTALILPRVSHKHGPPAPPAPPTPPAPPAPPAASTPPTQPDSSAVSVQPGRVVVRGGKNGADETDLQVEVIRIAGDEEARKPDRPMPPMPPMPPLTMGGHPLVLPYVSRDKGSTELLGTRDFDGVRADGKRTTRTIPAGAIGNEKPIAIVSEQWFSPDLNVVVMTRNLDPRSGETVYRLTNIKRGEPSADLFRVPTDYKVRNEERPERKR
ncbi:MAG TPA: hypothetical protein VMU79_10855 [Casimicrobiaceae bacterium]|nr:hypothetical protein [Casimicrobiaceae bacterium]